MLAAASHFLCRCCLEITTESDPLRPDLRDLPVVPAAAQLLGERASPGPRFGEEPSSLPQGRKHGTEAASTRVGDRKEEVNGRAAMPAVNGGVSPLPAKKDGKLERRQTEAGPGDSLPSSGVMWNAMTKEWLPTEIYQCMDGSRANAGTVLSMRMLRRSDFNGRLQDVNKARKIPGHLFRRHVSCILSNLDGPMSWFLLLSTTEVDIEGAQLGPPPLAYGEL